MRGARSHTEIAAARLRQQGLAATRFASAEEVVAWLGAVQAQEYPGAKWALALRMRRAADVDIERTFAEGRILRTHVMRPTWHFVAPADIRWLLALTAPRVRAAVASYDRKLGIDAAVIARSNRAIARALEGDVHLTRQELRVVLERAGIQAAGVQRLAHITIHAELDAVICSGAPRGKHLTYALLDERVPAVPVASREQSLGELARRYFTSHGPAQIQDFVWWSGLRAADARAAVDAASCELASEVVDGQTYWRATSPRRSGPHVRRACLLPLYDEYLIAYKDRRAALHGAYWKPIVSRDPFAAAIVVDGRLAGFWKRTQQAGRVMISLDVTAALKRADRRLIEEAVRRYTSFCGLDDDVVRTSYC